MKLTSEKISKLNNGAEDVVTGTLGCPKCRGEYPILAGIAVVLEDPGSYLIAHIKGVAREVSEKHFPAKYRDDMIEAFHEIESEHIEEDLESERVAALYVMTHYLGARGDWWKPKEGEFSRELEDLVRRYWDKGPFEKIRQGIEERFKSDKISLVELGCGVGGLYGALSASFESYLGVDSSFASIALARKIVLGAGSAKGAFHVPGDLLEGGVSQDVSRWVKPVDAGTRVDFVVSDASAPALKKRQWDVCASLNMIDMLESPEQLPVIQKSLVKPRGLAVQSSPYIWHPQVAKALKKACKGATSSAEVVRMLYERAGLKIEKSDEQVPWLFFKNYRQIELYSVHILFAQA